MTARIEARIRRRIAALEMQHDQLLRDRDTVLSRNRAVNRMYVQPDADYRTVADLDKALHDLVLRIQRTRQRVLDEEETPNPEPKEVEQLCLIL